MAQAQIVQSERNQQSELGTMLMTSMILAEADALAAVTDVLQPSYYGWIVDCRGYVLLRTEFKVATCNRGGILGGYLY